MKITLMILLGVGAIRAALVIGMSAAALWLMARLASPRRRRRGNPALWSGLMLVASGGVAMALLVVRQILVWIDEGERWWFLLYRDPDLIGTLGFALSSGLVALGVMLLIRAIHATLYRGAPGDVPRLLGGRGRNA